MAELDRTIQLGILDSSLGRIDVDRLMELNKNGSWQMFERLSLA